MGGKEKAGCIVINIMTDVQGGTFYLQFPFNRQIIALVKSIDGRKWNPDLKLWSLPATPAQANMIDRVLSQRQYTADSAFHEMLNAHNASLGIMNAQPTPRETSTPCWRHQLVGIDLIERRAAVYLAYQMGSGKTKTVIDACGILGLKRILILAPKSVVQEWPREFAKHGKGYGIRCIALNRKSVAYRQRVAEKAISMGPTALVINYEASWHDPFSEWSLDQQWDLVVLDEATKCKEPKARVSKHVHSLAARASRRVCLSGTPITNSPLDLWSQCKFLDVGIFGSSFHAYKARYAVLGGFQGKQVLNFRNLEDLNRRFHEIAHRVTKEECLDLPPTVDVVREVELGAKAVRHYTAAEGQFMAELEEGRITLANVLVETLRLEQITGGVAQYDERPDVERIDTAKRDALVDIMEGLPSTEPLVVFCRFLSDLDAVHDAARQCNRTSSELSGRTDELAEFRRDGTQSTVLAVQTQAGGMGVDLTRSSTCVFYSLGASMGDYLQARARLDRPGQTKNVTYIHLLATCSGRNTVDHKVFKILERKEFTAEKVLAHEILAGFGNSA